MLSWECGRIRTCHALLVGLVLYQLLRPEASASAGIAQPATFEIRTEHLHREQTQQNRGPDASGHFGHVERDAEILREIPGNQCLQGPLRPCLVVDALEVVRYALVDHVHPFCDLAGRIAQHDEVHYLTLAFAQYGVSFHSLKPAPRDRILPIW